MRRLLGRGFAAVSIVVLAQAAAAAQSAAPATRADEATKLAEAHTILEVMYPPASREQMMGKMLGELTVPLRRNMPFVNDIEDPGLKALFRDFFDHMLEGQRTLMSRHMPAMMDAMAQAYAHMFSLAELKDIHAFAESETGRVYFSHMMSVLGDPAVQKVSAEMMTDAQQLAKADAQDFKDKVTTYLKAHPQAADELKILSQSQALPRKIGT